ncbi:hypothetical protein [endosymbiont GvMRE of Glomus versiforme]|uniref:hypothetical protein n=1 Tax=endosymbiont GvMRE of Glomus versiforme TaxID=2039283 RepID=UPI000EE5FAB0|nr:hypothetical protein [endosymbiont GvMRE of Glomus versiforme]RHZ37001.1 hypothetical protein GvMRE_I2g125 [endosymbiont GvMRE of Glomus versiforme]
MANYIFEWIFFANSSNENKIEITFGNLQEEWKYDYLKEAKGKKINAFVIKGEKATKLNKEISRQALEDFQKFLSNFMGSTLIIKGAKKEPTIVPVSEEKVNFIFESEDFESVIITKGEDEKKILRDLEKESEQEKPKESSSKEKTQQEQEVPPTSNEKMSQWKIFLWISGIIIFLLLASMFLYFWWKKERAKK